MIKQSSRNRIRVASAISSLFILSFSSTNVQAQNLTVQEWVDQFVASCVGSGSSNTASGLVEANGDISLKKIALSGNITGQVRLEHKDARLLSDGINNAMSSVAAQQAGEVRVCLAPLRTVLLQVMQQQFGNASGKNNKIDILTPEENSLLRAIANTKGQFGKVGEAVQEPALKQKTGFGDVRLRATAKLLENRGYIIDYSDYSGVVLGLNAQGDDYVLRVGIAN